MYAWTNPAADPRRWSPNLSIDAERQLRWNEPSEAEVASRLATVRVGVALTIIVTLGAATYTLFTADLPHRPLIHAVLVVAALSAIVVDRLPAERIVRSRWREIFFVGWSIADVALIAVMAAADGGATSPFAMLFVLPLLFGALSYPPPATAARGAVDVAVFLGVAAASGDGAAYGAFGAFALGCAAVMSTWESANQSRRRDALAETARALQTSEEESRLLVHQQQEVARFGQLALGGAEVGELLAEAMRILERVLEIDVGGVLQPVEGQDELLIRAASGLPKETIGVGRVPGGAGSQAGYALATGEPVIVEDWRDERRFGQPIQLAERGIRSGAAVTIRGQGEPFGVLAAQSRMPHRFTPRDVSFMQALANVLANAIERRDAEDRTRHAALHDPLTGLANRSLFLDRLGHALERSVRRESSVAVFFLDLDQFKLVNDSMGHAAGDELLAAVAPRLEGALRPGDTIARFGGDEFAVLIEEISGETDAIRAAERLGEVLTHPFVLRDREHFVSLSAGIAIGHGAETPETLLRDADAALYRAKEKGRGGYEIFDRVMRARVVEHVRTENDLRRALERQELELHYQPLVSLRDGTISSFEALLRWRHPERGLIGPAGFISVAEETRLIVPVGRWVIETACQEAARWQALQPDSRPVGVAVNVSARQLADPELPQVLERVIAKSGIDPATLSIELTESVLLEEFGAPERVLRSLKELGLRLALDDFGIGFSSLGYLKRLPLDSIKIDRTFVENLSFGSPEAAIVQAVSGMAGALELEVVAEGVETAEQLETIRDLGCGHAQGFHFTRPVERPDVDDLLVEQPWVGLSAGRPKGGESPRPLATEQG
jgi:diguanylate cyclase (GGDEF)-like protein